jgi:hypothetical protein
MSMLDKLRSAANGTQLPGGFKGLLAGAAIVWGSSTAQRIASDSMDAVQAAQGDLLALNQAIAEANEKLTQVPFVLQHNHTKITDAIAGGRFDQAVRERANVLAAPYPVPFPDETEQAELDSEDGEFAALRTTDDIPHRLLGVDEPVPGFEPSTSDGE